MTGVRVHHVESAKKILLGVEELVSTDQISAAGSFAQAHATLALVEQQRVANLIAYAADVDVIRGGNHEVNVAIREALGLS